MLILYPLLLMGIFTIVEIKQKKTSLIYYLLFYGINIISMIVINTNRVELQLFICVILTLVFLLALQNGFYIRKSYDDKFGEYQDKLLKMQMEEVNSIYLTMRGWRHDYHNHMQKIKAHMALDQYEEVGKYLNQLEDQLDKVEVKYKTGNVSIDAILNSKLSVAEKFGIEINCKAEVPKEINIEDVDICVIIGNLIDNAMEACDKLQENERRFLRVYICVLKKQLYISVSNATNEVVRKLDKEYITNKRGNHGHGLKRIDDIVEKYQGFINRKNEPGVFATEIMLPM